MRGMVEAWSTFLGVVIEKINFFWAGQRKNQLFVGWSTNKSAFLQLVSENINFFWDGMSLGTRDTCIEIFLEALAISNRTVDGNI